jgi:hypothetical protein
MVKLLLERRSLINDGSLHEASRGFHVQVIKLLLHAGHDPNYRSTKHGCRTALGEVALKASPPRDIAAAEEALDLLVSAEASPLLKVNGKTVIFLALDNRHNVNITRLLLDRILHKTLNSHENTYQSGPYCYSPTMYVAKGILLGPPSNNLLHILRAHGAEDRFYASWKHPQPPDAVGLPEEIREYEQERRACARHICAPRPNHATPPSNGRARVAPSNKQSSLFSGHRDHSAQKQQLRDLGHEQAIVVETSQLRWQQHNNNQPSMHSQCLVSSENFSNSCQSHRLVYMCQWGAHHLGQHTGYKVHGVRHVDDKRVREDLRMTELRSARGKIIGQVDLGELRKWQRELEEESSRATDREKAKEKGWKPWKLNELA